MSSRGEAGVPGDQGGEGSFPRIAAGAVTDPLWELLASKASDALAAWTGGGPGFVTADGSKVDRSSRQGMAGKVSVPLP